MSEQIKQEGEFKLKPRKTKSFSKSPEVTKVDLTQEAKPIVKEEEPIKVDLSNAEPKEEEKAVEPEVVNKEEAVVTKEEEPVLIQEIAEEEEKSETSIEETVAPSKTEASSQLEQLPENIQKVVEFMNDTGGSLTDYVRLNTDYSDVDNKTLLREYYKSTKPHLDSEDVDILLEDFDYDEDLDEDKDIRKKKIAYKEEIAKAKGFLTTLKDKYYEEIKLKPRDNQQQSEALDFFNRYKDEQQLIEERSGEFIKRTNNYFQEDFKGFDFNLGEKKFRYGLKETSSVANNQSDLSNFVKKFLNEKGEISDLGGYHKALYVANNSEKVINHFYEQGKADAIRDLTAKSKNISNEARPSADGNVFVNGLKVRAITGADSSKLKIKRRK